MSVRVRYAPSPTGLQHIGGVRTALFNYFFAKSQGGTFILRIEDTDQERTNSESIQDLYDTLEWLGIQWDEGPEVGGPFGPYVQSQRFALYKEHAEKLMEAGHAYYCYCSQERLDQLREDQTKSKSSQLGYDRHCRNLSSERKAEFTANGINPVVRFKVPSEGKTEFEDILLGTVKRKNKDINPDPIILKSDGFPTYHLANVIDDHYMEISHILRAQEWIPSGPLHILLYQAFGWELPIYCHLPMVMGKDGQKLSKRHGSTAVCEFREKGYLPEAVLNYISLIGWSLDDKTEFFTKDELEKVFSLQKINKAPGVFDYKKLEWFNGQYIRQKSDNELKDLLIPYLQKSAVIREAVSKEEMTILDGMLPLVKERLKLLSDIPLVAGFFFQELDSYVLEDLVPKKLSCEKTIEVLTVAKPLLQTLKTSSDEEVEAGLKTCCEELDVRIGDMMLPIRVAVTGTKMSPPLMASIRLLGVEKSLERVDNAIQFLKDIE